MKCHNCGTEASSKINTCEGFVAFCSPQCHQRIVNVMQTCCGDCGDVVLSILSSIVTGNVQPRLNSKFKERTQ